jgi:hypothetical protein
MGRTVNIIGITGKAGSGKDTVADILVRKHGFVKVALADPMKEFCARLFDFSVNQLWGPSEARNAPDLRYLREHTWVDDVPGCQKVCACCGHYQDNAPRCYLTPRYALQQLGSEWGRAMFQDVWLDAALHDAACFSTGDRGVVIPDVRFDNELAGIRREGGRIWHRPGEGSLKETPAAAHASETAKLDCDAQIPWMDNPGQLPDVVKQLLESESTNG